MYLMVTVISNQEKLKPILKSLKAIDIKGSIVINSQGSSSIDNNYGEYRPALDSALSSISEVTNYKKTILSLIETDEKVKEAMDTIQALLGHNLKKPNTGIMFTIPLAGMGTNFVKGQEMI